MKLAVLSMDVEEWYHMAYLDESTCDRSYSMLDGIDTFHEILEANGVRGTFFVLGELVPVLATKLRELDTAGFEIGSHGWSHVRPVEIPEGEFREEVVRCRRQLEDLLGREVRGFRAASFGMDRPRIDILEDLGFGYDTSHNPYENNPYYGRVDMTGFANVVEGVYRRGDFFEFELCRAPMGGRTFPVSGGGYFRIFPWWFVGAKIKRYLKTRSYYNFYIHPMELSRFGDPPFPPSAGFLQRRRFSTGRRSVKKKLQKLIDSLKSEGYRIATLSEIRSVMMDPTADRVSHGGEPPRRAGGRGG